MLGRVYDKVQSMRIKVMRIVEFILYVLTYFLQTWEGNQVYPVLQRKACQN
jgi:hypothetical protein